jgi:hypothetical protein
MWPCRQLLDTLAAACAGQSCDTGRPCSVPPIKSATSTLSRRAVWPHGAWCAQLCMWTWHPQAVRHPSDWWLECCCDFRIKVVVPGSCMVQRSTQELWEYVCPLGLCSG